MKDRVKRTNMKKPSHKLFRFMILTCGLCTVLGSFFSVVLIRVSSENKTLNQTIQNYTIQIDMLQKSDSSDLYLKNNK